MEGNRAASARLIRTARVRQRSKEVQTVVASGVIGLVGALIGGVISYAATSRQVASQEELAATAQEHGDQLDRIARRDDLYAAFYASLVEFRGTIRELSVRPQDRQDANFEAFLATSEDVTKMTAALTPVQLQGSPRVISAADNALDWAVQVRWVTLGIGRPSDRASLEEAEDGYDAAMQAVLSAMRDDLNVNDVPDVSLEELIEHLKRR